MKHLFTLALLSLPYFGFTQTSKAYFYPLDGNVLDASGNNVHGTYTGATFNPDKDREGNLCALNTGDDPQDQVRLPFVNSGTVGFWIKLNKTFPSETYFVNGQQKLSGLSDTLTLWPCLFDKKAKIKSPVGQWTHIAFSYERGEIKTYVNGKSLPIPNCIHTAFTVYSISRVSVDDVYYNPNVLSDTQIDSLYTTNASCGTVTDLQTEAYAEINIDLFPNPSIGTFEIRGLAPFASLSIYDITGILVETKIKPTYKLPKGFYIVHVDLMGKKVEKKLQIY